MNTTAREVAQLELSDTDPSDSSVQREVEIAVLARVHAAHPDWISIEWPATAARLGLPPVWQSAKPDAVWRTENGETVVAECYLRVDELKAGHRRKLAMDALKLLALRHSLPAESHVRCLLVVPQEMANRLKGGGWFPVALQLAAEIVPVELLDDEIRKLGDAVRRQASGQARQKRVVAGRSK